MQTDIRKYVNSKQPSGSNEFKKMKTPEKKAKRVVFNSDGNCYEDTDYMVCSICIKAFKTYDKYFGHMEDHKTKLSYDSFSTMKVFKEVSEKDSDNVDPTHLYKRINESQITTTVQTPSSSRSIVENPRDPLCSAQAIVKLGLPETFGVTIKNFVTTMKTIDASVKLQGISNITITTDEFQGAIISISNNIIDQLVRRVRQSPYFTLHLAEFMDIKNFMSLIVTIRYKYEKRIQDEILFCQRLAGTTADEIYVVITNFMNAHQMDWEKCVGICMDDVRAQSESLKNFMQHIFESGLAPYLTYTFSRRASFIEQHLPNILLETLHDAVQIVNILKQNPMLKLEHDIDDGYQQIFYHTDQYWLSYGRLLTRLFEMLGQCKEMPELISFKEKMNEPNWLHKLTYLVDIFEFFTRLHRDLQTEQFSTFHIYDKITASIDLLKMYRSNVELYNFIQFTHLQQLMKTEKVTNISPEIRLAVLEHLRCLHNYMNHYLPIADWEIENCSWIRNPFDVVPDKMPANLSEDEKEMLLNLRKDGFIAVKFDEKKLDYFWASTHQKYPDLATKAMKYLLIFKNSQLSEVAFALLVDIRTKMLTDLDHEESYLRIKLSNIEPESRALVLATT